METPVNVLSLSLPKEAVAKSPVSFILNGSVPLLWQPVGPSMNKVNELAANSLVWPIFQLLFDQ